MSICLRGRKCFPRPLSAHSIPPTLPYAIAVVAWSIFQSFRTFLNQTTKVQPFAKAVIAASVELNDIVFRVIIVAYMVAFPYLTTITVRLLWIISCDEPQFESMWGLSWVPSPGFNFIERPAVPFKKRNERLQPQTQICKALQHAHQACLQLQTSHRGYLWQYTWGCRRYWDIFLPLVHPNDLFYHLLTQSCNSWKYSSAWIRTSYWPATGWSTPSVSKHTESLFHVKLNFQNDAGLKILHNQFFVQFTLEIINALLRFPIISKSSSLLTAIVLLVGNMHCALLISLIPAVPNLPFMVTNHIFKESFSPRKLHWSFIPIASLLSSLNTCFRN